MTARVTRAARMRTVARTAGASDRAERLAEMIDAGRSTPPRPAPMAAALHRLQEDREVSAEWWAEGDRIGEPCKVLGLDEGDPYIFRFQSYGKIARKLPDGQFMITLDSAWGEWGPVSGERLLPLRGPLRRLT